MTCRDNQEILSQFWHKFYEYLDLTHVTKRPPWYLLFLYRAVYFGLPGLLINLAHAVFLWFGHLYLSRPDDCISHLPLWYLLFLYRLFIWGYLPPSSCSVAVKHSPLLSHKPDTNRSNSWSNKCELSFKFMHRGVNKENSAYSYASSMNSKLSVIQLFVAKGL